VIAAPAAVALAALPLATAAPAPGVQWSSMATTAPNGGPIKVNVLRIDRAALAGRRLTVVLAHGRTLQRQRTSAMARSARAVVATNGAVWGVPPPVAGDPIGVVISDGRLVSEPLEGRSALLVPRDPAAPPVVRTLQFDGRVDASGRSRIVDGVDRLRGFIPACGGRGGDTPTERPNGTLVCHDASELIAYDRRFGHRTRPARTGVEVTVRHGVATSVSRGGSTTIPSHGVVLSGSGDAASFLRRVRPRETVGVDLSFAADGQPIVAGDYAAALSGGPRVLRDGQADIQAAAEGYEPPNDPGWAHRIADRNPRTMAGVDDAGRLIMATVDGRQPGYSVGLSYVEGAALMRALGARDAINLDGGGSATMVVRGRVVNSPSDDEGERPVADALAVVP
jgi:Phosphodiester glycosidase